MTESPRVSVIVPFFNRQQYLPACIEALLAQDDVGGAVEIIMVDNRSTDASASVVGRYPQLTLLREETPGVYAARNAGIRKARAPLVAFTDADCVADRDWLRSVCDGMRDPGVAILIGACRYPAAASRALTLLAAYENAKAEYVVTRCAPAYHFAYANNMAVRASVFEQFGAVQGVGARGRHRAGAPAGGDAAGPPAGVPAPHAGDPPGVPARAGPAPPPFAVHADELADRVLQGIARVSARRGPAAPAAGWPTRPGGREARGPGSEPQPG